MIELTKVQLQAILSKLLEQENGLMHSERSNYLQESTQNKGNGYRKAFAVGLGKQIELKMPRDRLGLFQPMVLALIRDQKQQLEDLSFELYSNGLTTSQIGSFMKKIYGKHYSKQVISNITSTFYSQMQSWRERPLDTTYLAVYIDTIHLKIRRGTVSSEAFYILLGVKEDYTREVIGIYPNPVKNVLNIKMDDNLSQITIYNLQGQKVLENNTKNTDVSKLTSGFYLIKILAPEGKTATKRFVKK